ncbi:MAG: shikimate dehydrogenase [Planctomycetes bacterium]|nr:shikimate dehydrogenase [Planctomycetota bacterium]
MICVPIVETTNDRAAARLEEAAVSADLAELRIDYLQEPPDLRRLLENRPLPVIVTNRPVREGGLFAGDEMTRVALLREAASLGADYVDIEHDAVGFLGEPAGARVIVSYHNWDETPENLVEVARMLVGTGADIIKIATRVNKATDNFRLCQLQATTGVATIVTGMGPKGIPSRVLSRKFGSYLTFAALSKNATSAPGQLTIADLVDTYNFRSTNRNTKVYGVIGNPIGHSLSPHIHNAAFRKLGEPAVYVPFEVEDFEVFLKGCNCLDPVGFSVTIPHKEEAFRLVGETDAITAKIGAANTIRFGPDGLAGTNTDWQAALEAIRAGLVEEESLAGKRALLLGAGGAARAIAYGLASQGCRITIANRTLERAQALAREVSCDVVAWQERSGVDFDIVANSTSLGMYPAAGTTPLPKEAFRSGQIVFDAVYNPRETRFLREAREAGCRVVDGLEMFVQQALAQLGFWSFGDVPANYLRKAAMAGLGSFGDGE